MNNQNIIVYGTRRTGTSLMMELLSKSNNLTLNKTNNEKSIYNLNKEGFKNLQPFYNEGLFVKGITEKNANEYVKTENNIIKFLGPALFNTHDNYLPSFKKIIVMIRHWKNHAYSMFELNNIIIKENILEYENISKRIKSLDEFVRDYTYEPCIEYAYYYSNIILDLVKRKYYSKVIIVDFEQLKSNPESINNILKKHDLNISKYKDIIDYKTSKHSDSAIKNKNNKRVFIEFLPGFFEFLDKLYNCYKNGKITKEILDLINIWIPRLELNIKKRDIMIYNKYKIILSSWLETDLKKLKLI